jgi:hypothetical protein
MSETQWAHSLLIFLNPGKLYVLVFQTGASSLGCNDYISNSKCSSFKTRCLSFYWLVAND